ncbi:hypothetical protein GCM10010218_00750 [Streptomyces mashuensis]|uniref:Uncharacterized protein n=1 Tax=Streptomyces mashuensis TaxID=33904 RepID=A0A919AUB9_9ACTN|nr:hypothetical protein GCM10010218_00750 [Streptomyces mashuensis]
MASAVTPAVISNWADRTWAKTRRGHQGSMFVPFVFFAVLCFGCCSVRAEVCTHRSRVMATGVPLVSLLLFYREQNEQNRLRAHNPHSAHKAAPAPHPPPSLQHRPPHDSERKRWGGASARRAGPWPAAEADA